MYTLCSHASCPTVCVCLLTGYVLKFNLKQPRSQELGVMLAITRLTASTMLQFTTLATVSWPEVCALVPLGLAHAGQ